MEKLAKYRQLVHQILLDSGNQKPAYGDIEVEKIFGTDRDHYQIVHVGWEGDNWMHCCIIHIDIKGEKIWRYLERYRR
jgi:hypothetical protein